MELELGGCGRDNMGESTSDWARHDGARAPAEHGAGECEIWPTQRGHARSGQRGVGELHLRLGTMRGELDLWPVAAGRSSERPQRGFPTALMGGTGWGGASRSVASGEEGPTNV
jgi:hypothetical protein